MEKRRLGYSNLYLSRIGFGAWAIGGGNWEFGWGPQDDRESIHTIHKAIDLGINWIDTAAAYGLGHSEEVVGKAIKSCRDRVIIATKCSLVWEGNSGGKISHRLKAWSVRKEAEDSLRRLGVDVIDLYQIHWPNPDEDIEEGWAEIAKLIQEGKIRYGGVSNFNVRQMERCKAIHPIASLQPPYHMLDRHIESEILPYCAQNNIGVIAYSPMASGLLTGRMTRERIAALPEDDWRRRGYHFQEPMLSINLSLVEELSKVAKRFNRSVGELAVAWVLRRSEITAAIVGARNPQQIAEIVPAADWALQQEVTQEIESLLAAREQAIKQASG